MCWVEGRLAYHARRTWLLLCSSAGCICHWRRERPCEKFQRFTEASKLPVSSSQG